jgi:hypothetical protein
LPAGALAYTFCQVPVVVQLAPEAAPGITVHLAEGRTVAVAGHRLDAAHSADIFSRDGVVQRLTVELPSS